MKHKINNQLYNIFFKQNSGHCNIGYDMLCNRLNKIWLYNTLQKIFITGDIYPLEHKFW